MRLRYFLAAALCAALALCGCDDHEAVDVGIHVGYVLCDDHSTMSLEAYRSQDRVRAVGVVFAESGDDHPTLAVLLDELPEACFADTLGMDMGTSRSVTAFDGYTNTVSMRNSYNARTGKGSPLADAVFRRHAFGQSDFIPCVSECRLLYMALPQVNRVIAALMALHPECVSWQTISQDSSDGSCWYWTSTEDADDRTNRAWLCSMATGGFQQTPKDEMHPARAVVELRY